MKPEPLVILAAEHAALVLLGYALGLRSAADAEAAALTFLRLVHRPEKPANLEIAA